MKISFTTVVVLLLLATGVAARVGGGDIIFETKKKGAVTFSHDKHVAAIGLTCTDCHPALFGAKAKQAQSPGLHKKQGASCGACHNGKKAFDLKKDCNACHVKEVKK